MRITIRIVAHILHAPSSLHARQLLGQPVVIRCRASDDSVSVACRNGTAPGNEPGFSVTSAAFVPLDCRHSLGGRLAPYVTASSTSNRTLTHLTAASRPPSLWGVVRPLQLAFSVLATTIAPSLLGLQLSRHLSASATLPAAHEPLATTSSKVHKQAPLPESGDKTDPAKRLAALQEVIHEELGRQYSLDMDLVPPHYRARLPDPGLMRLRVVAMRRELGAEVTAAILSKNVSLLGHGPPHSAGTRERLGAVAAACGCSLEQALQPFTRSKGAGELLQCTPAEIERRLLALKEVLGLEDGMQLLALCSRAAVFAKLPPETMIRRAAVLGELLGLEAAGVACLLRRAPQLLGRDVSGIQNALEALQEALGMGSWSEAVELGRRWPVFLTLDSQRIHESVAWLQERLGYSTGDVYLVKIMLTVSARNLHARLAALPSALGITPSEARRLVAQSPRLLMMQHGLIAANWATLKSATARCCSWREQVLACTASSLVTLLSYNRQRLTRRIEVALQAGLPPDSMPSLLQILKGSEADFEALLTKVAEAGAAEGRSSNKAKRLKDTCIALHYSSLAAQL